MLLGFLTRSVFAGTLPLSRTACSTANAVPTLSSLSVCCVPRFRRGLCLVVFTFLLSVVFATFSVPKTNYLGYLVSRNQGGVCRLYAAVYAASNSLLLLEGLVR